MTLPVRLFVYVVFMLSVHSAFAQEQLRISASLPNPVCAGQSLTVSYSSNQDGVLSVRLNDLKIAEQAIKAGNNQAITATVPINQAAGQYNVSLANVSSNGGTTTTYLSGTVITTVNAALPPPSVTTPAPYCPGDAASALSAVPTANGNSLIWYGMNATGGTASSNPPIPSTDQSGSFTYYVSQIGPNSCESNRAPIQVTVNPRPDKPVTTPLSACFNANPPSITAGVTASGPLKWYDQQTGGSARSTPILSTNQVGSITYYVSQTNQFNCESERASITFTVNQLPSAPTIPAQTTLYCQNAPANPLQATPIAGAKLNWYTSQTSSTAYAMLIPSTTDAIPKTYYVSQTDVNGCETAPANRASITITTVSNPTMPVVSTPVTYCQYDTSFPLSATPTTTNTLRWYGMNSTGGTPDQQAPKPSTDTPSTGLYYYVSQIDGNQCEGQRAIITVVVNAKPTTPVTSNVTICQNATSASLTKGVTATGTLKWYTTQTGGTGSFTEPQLSTTNPGVQSDYYVSQTINGCESDRSPIHLTVIGLPQPPTVSSDAVLVCQGTVADPLSATPLVGGTLIWYDPVTGATSSSIRPRTDVATDINNPTLYSVSQTVNGCEGPKATVRVATVAKPALPTVSVQSLTVCQFATPASLTSIVVGQNLKWYTAQTGGTALAATPIPPTDQARTLVYYVSQTNQNNCESDRATVTVDVRTKPNPPSVTSSNICANQLAPLTATFDPNAVPNWYGTNANGTASPTAPIPTTAVIGTPITYYVSQSVNGCESDKVNFTVTVLPQPLQPTVSANPVLLCQGTAPTALTATASGTLNWYTVPTDGAPSPTLSIQPTTPGSTPYYVSQVDGNKCESARTQIIVTVNAKPAAPTVTASLTACQTTTANSITLTALGTGLKWYNDASSTTVIPTPILSTTAPATFTYYVSQTDPTTGCESGRASITATILRTPAPPTASTIYYCLNDTKPSPLTAIASAGGSLNFYTTASGGFPSPSITPLTTLAGTTTYYVSQLVNGCESSRANLDVTIRSLPQSPTVTTNPIPLCQNTSPTPLTATASGTLNWYTTPTGGIAYPTIYPSTTTSGLTPYYVSQTDANGCESVRTPVTVFIKTQPVAPTVATNTLTYCQSTTPVMLTAVTSGNPNWYIVPTNGTATASITFVPSMPSQSTYYVSQTVDGCESPRIPIVVTVQATPLPPSVSANPIYCQGSTGSITPLSATAPNGGVLVWYTQEQGGIGTTVPPTPSVNNATTITYFVSQSIGGCESARVKLIATVKAPPDLPTVVPQVTACQNGTAILTAALKGGVSLNWYTVPVGGGGSTATPTPDTRSAGTFYYYVSQTDANGCESSRAVITVRINPAPSAPAVSSVNLCQGVAATPLNVTPGGGTLNWYTTQTGGAASPVAPIPITTIAATTPYYVSLTDLNGCESARSILLVTVSATPAAPTVPAIAPVCQGSTPVGLSTLGTNLKWYADPTSTVTISPIVQTTTTGPVNFYVSQTINGCESARALVTVLVNPQPTAPVVTVSQSGCQDVAALPLTAAGTGLQWYDQSDNLIGTPTPATRVDVATVYVYKVTQTVNGCVSPKATILYTVNVTPLPGVITPVSVCQSSATSPLQVTSGTNLKWYDPTGAITTTAPIPAITATSTITSYSVTQTINNCESRKARIDVTTTAPATARIEGSPTVYIGSSATLTLTLSGQGPYSYTLSDGSASIIPADVGSATTIRSITVTPTTATTATYTITRIANACGNGTASGSATVTVLTPTISTPLLSTSVVCAGNTLNTFTTSFSTTGNFATNNEFTIEIGSAAVNELARQYVTVSSAISSNRGTTISAIVPPSVAPGQYYVRVRASNGLFPITGATTTSTILVKAPPTATISVSRDSIYQRQSVSLNFAFTGEPDWTGHYLIGNERKTFTSPTSVYSLTLTPNATTTYKLLDVRDGGCGVGSIVGVDSARVKVNVLLAADDPLSNSVKVYPVPTDGAVTVDVDQAILKQPVQLRLIGLNGQIRQEMTTKKQQTILDLEKESAGIYLLQITVGDRSTVRKILKR